MSVIPWSSEVFPAVGQCIFAREGHPHAGPFTDEHIIPFGLLPKGGDWFLPEASCGTCADITHRFEQACMRGIMGTFRAKLNLKTRRKKQREAPQQVLFKRPDGSIQTGQMGHVALPIYCIGFDWNVPGVLRNEPSELFSFGGRIIVRYPEGELEKFVPDQHGFRLARVRELDVGRMLAKIAHCYAYAKCGIDSFEPALLDLILGRAENAPYWVGGHHGEPLMDQPNCMHDIYPITCRLEPGSINYLGVVIRLFAFYNMPRYLIIVGKQLKEISLPKKQTPEGVS